MRRNFITGSIIFALLLNFSCQKDKDIFVPYENIFDTTWKSPLKTDPELTQLMEDLWEEPGVDSLSDISQGDTIEIADDIRVMVPVSSCTENGGNSASGPVTLKWWLLAHPGQFIRNQKPSSLNENPLQTIAEINLQILKDGQPLRLAADKYVRIRYYYPTPVKDLLIHFPDAGGPDNYLNWVLAQDGSSVSTFSMQDPQNPGQSINGYDVKIRHLDWVNCGKLPDTTNRTNITATLPNIFTNSNTRVYVVFRDWNAVTQMKDDPVSRIYLGNKIPLNTRIMLVSISAIGNDLYLGTEEMLISGQQNIELKPAKKSLVEIRDFLDQL